MVLNERGKDMGRVPFVDTGDLARGDVEAREGIKDDLRGIFHAGMRRGTGVRVGVMGDQTPIP